MGVLENAVSLSLEEGKARLDALMKKFLSNRQILAVMLKKFVSEFKGCTVADIETKYIEADTISVGATPVEKDFTNRPANENVEGIANEDTSLSEGRITYDVIFKAKAPGADGKLIGLYINVEAQGRFHTGYPLEARALYYAARRFSSQLTSISEGTDYGRLEKVYSIWVCVGDVPDSAAGTVSLYHLTKDDLIGEYDGIRAEAYDKINLVMIRLNERVEVEDSFLNALKVIFSNASTGKQKIAGLEQAGIHTKQKFNEEVDTMCNYSDWIESKGIAKGIEKGIAQGIGIGREEGIGIGREEGIGIGREEGLQKGREMLIISLDRQGVARETIAAAAGLTVEQVAAIIDAAAVTA